MEGKSEGSEISDRIGETTPNIHSDRSDILRSLRSQNPKPDLPFGRAFFEKGVDAFGGRFGCSRCGARRGGGAELGVDECFADRLVEQSFGQQNRFGGTFGDADGKFLSSRPD